MTSKKRSDFKLRVYQLLDERDTLKYNLYLKKLPNNPFYKRELIAPRKKQDKLYYFVLEKEQVPIVLMPFYLREIFSNGKFTGLYDVTSPYGYSGPLYAADTSTGVLVEFWKMASRWYADNRVISEFIRFNLESNHNAYNGLKVASLQNVTGSIINEECQWKNFKSKVRNNYRKALNNNITVEIYHNPVPNRIIEKFYSIYIKTMWRKKASPDYLYDLGYFQEYADKNPSNCALALAYEGDIPISTEFLLLSDTMVYSFLGGTLSEYFSKRPNEILKIRVLEWARSKDYTNYILGGGRSDGDSLYKYKKAFFPQDKDAIYYTGRKIIDPENYARLTDEVHLEEPLGTEYFPLYRYQV